MRLVVVLFVSSMACGSVTSNGDGDVDAGCDGEVDCMGVCNGTAVEDCLGVCNGTAVEDCAGVCDGAAAIDNCGVCANPEQACKWPDSESSRCHDTTTLVECPEGPVGQDGHYDINVPVYVVDTDTVTDPITGLVWERNPPIDVVVKSAAITYCDNLALDGADDWRVPTFLELATVLNAMNRGSLGGVYPEAFGAIPQNSFVWSSTVDPNDATRSFAIATNFPTSAFRVNETAGADNLVRCVRGTGFAGDLVADGDVVIDQRTNLIWQSAVNASAIWVDALATCENLTTDDGRSEWRLPNLKELYSIVDRTQSAPAISEVFAERPNDVFWTSSPVAFDAAPNLGAYSINFSSGLTNSIVTDFGESHAVRCVHSP